MSQLSLCLLGSFEATLDGVTITSFKTNKVRALLAYLAIEGDRPHRRESLAGLLWPDWPESYARSSLRSALANLRQVIGDRDADPPRLLITRDTIQFNGESDHSVDVRVFEAFIVGQDEDEVTLAMEKAVDLYRGEFLEGFSVPDSQAFDEWALLRREQCRGRMQDALHRLIDRLLGAGDHRRAEGHARHSLALDPWDETAHRGLMRALALGGQRMRPWPTMMPAGQRLPRAST